MKKYNILLIFTLSAIVIILTTINYNLNSKLDGIKETISCLYAVNSKDFSQINNLIFESHFKDDLVLSNFNNSITIIIAFFTVLIALGAVFSFKRIDDDINKLKLMSTDIHSTKTDLEETQKRIQTQTLLDRNFNFHKSLLSITSSNEKININDSNYLEILLQQVTHIRISNDYINEIEYSREKDYMSDFFQKRNNTSNNFTIDDFKRSFDMSISHILANLEKNNLNQDKTESIINVLKERIYYREDKFNENIIDSVKKLIDFYNS